MNTERAFDMGVEFWNSVFQWGSVGLIAITFFVGAGALWTSNRINQRQTERLVVLEKELASAKTTLAEQQERAAKAEKELLDVQSRFKDWRTITPEREKSMVAWLLPFAGEAVSVLALSGDEESRRFAAKITDVFQKAGLVARLSVVPERRKPIGGMQLDAGQNKTDFANRIAGALIAPTPLGKLKRGTAILPDMVELMIWPKAQDE